MNHAIALLNAGISNALHSISKLERVNNSAENSNGRKVPLMEANEYYNRMDNLNSIIKEFKSAQSVLKTSEMSNINRFTMLSTVFIIQLALFAVLLYSELISCSFVYGFTFAFALFGGLIWKKVI